MSHLLWSCSVWSSPKYHFNMKPVSLFYGEYITLYFCCSVQTKITTLQAFPVCGHKLLQNIPKIKFLNREFEKGKPQCCEQHTDIQVKIILGRNDCTNVVRRSRGKKHIFYCSHVFSARQHSRSTQTAMAISTLTVWYSAFQLNCTFSLINELIIQSNLIDTTTILVIHEQYDHDTMEKQSLHSN